MDWQGYEIDKRVVCVVVVPVGSLVREWFPDFAVPAKGEILTINFQIVVDDRLMLAFVEYPLRSITFECGHEHCVGYPADHFRPLDETRLDQFRQYLNHVPADHDMVPA